MSKNNKINIKNIHIQKNINLKDYLVKEGELVKKSNALTRMKLNNFNVNELRLFASLVSSIKTEDTELKEFYSINVKDIIKNEQDYSYMKNLCKNFIGQMQVEIKHSEDSFTIMPVFLMMGYNNGCLGVQFNPYLKEHLIKLKEHLTIFSLEEYKKLSSVNSMRLYEILQSYSNLPEIEIEIKELHRMLNTPKSQIANFGLFQREALLKAHREITSKTNFYFEYEPIKGGKGGRTSPVIAVRFIFSKKKIGPVKEKKEKEDKEKTAKNNNKNFLVAWNCVKSCKGNCDTLSKKPNKTACTICKTKNLLEEVLKKQEEHCPSEKVTPQKTTYKSGGVEVEQANFLEYINKNN